MAKEKEEQKQPTVFTLSKPVIMIILFIFAVLGYATFWSDRGGEEARAESAHALVVEVISNRLTADELQTTVNSNDIKEVKEGINEYKIEVDHRFDATEKMAIASEARQQSLLKGQESLRRGQEADTVFKQQIIKEIADLGGYLKSIENID